MDIFIDRPRELKILEALLASVLILEKGAVGSDQNLCLCLWVTVFKQDQVQAVYWCRGWSTPSPTCPPWKREGGHTQQVSSPTEKSQFSLWYWHGLEWLQQRKQKKLAARRSLALPSPDSACAAAHQLIWDVKGRDKPSMPALITCFTVSKAL